jgi:hypothetical protein
MLLHDRCPHRIGWRLDHPLMQRSKEPPLVASLYRGRVAVGWPVRSKTCTTPSHTVAPLCASVTGTDCSAADGLDRACHPAIVCHQEFDGKEWLKCTGGLYIIDPSGKKLGRIVHGFADTANVAFEGDDWKTVYFCTRTSLGMFKARIPGVPVPVTKKG